MAKTFIPTDPLFGAQWHLLNTGQDIMGLPQAEGAYRNDINVTGVWPDYTGEGVVVGVMDDGFQPEHPDLNENYLADLAYNFITNTPGQTAGPHGTATTGLIVAAQNDLGGVGVAFEASAIGYTSQGGFDLLNNFVKASAHMLADGVDVSSNSWSVVHKDVFSVAAFQPIFNNVTLNLAQLGRDGLGTVTVFAAGNERSQYYNTSSELTGSSPYVINVAAANVDGTVTSYSTPGPGILVAAPGSGVGTEGTSKDIASIVTTDLLGTAGFNTNLDGDYTNVSGDGSHAFNGTSAAAPIVSGVVALMLEANPLLGYRDVQEILAYSAKNPDQVATWQVNGATDFNGGGLLFNDDLGFGLVDAHAAVRLAETWEKQSTFDNAARPTAAFSDDVVVLQSGDSVNLSVTFTDAIRVQHALLSLHLQASSADIADLSVRLIGPDGQTSTLFMDPSLYAPFAAVPLSELSYAFDTLRNWGQISTSGDWVLSISNNTGGLVRFEAGLSLIGDAVTPGETFIYTDDYGRLGAEDADRASLSSTQAGPHTLNAAAVTSDTMVDLSGHEATIAGVATSFAPDMSFARVVTGDGNDTLTGDEGDTVFFTGRGINSVDGGGGHDTLQVLWDFKAYSQTAYGIQTVIVGADSVDYATDIAALQFADGTLTLDGNSLVNDLFYAGQVPSLLNSGTTAESHYDSVGWKAGLDPNAVFDTSAYLANHAALKAAGTNPLDYFHETGWKNGDDPSARFDTSLYLKLNPDVAAAGVDPLQHYLEYGMHEGREVRPVVDSAHLQNAGTFDATFYLLANEDVALAGANAYEHWITYGQKEGRDPNAYFDVSYYLSANPDVAAAGANPLEHYMTFGWKEGRDPSQAFDTEGYLDHYTDVAAAGIDPLVHYLIYGIGEGRQSTWDFA